MTIVLLAVAVFVLVFIWGYRLARADLRAWAEQSALRDLERRTGLTVVREDGNVVRLRPRDDGPRTAA